ncbi:MAG TPA: glycerophosphodiester phosphodiesterase family protein, partial [Motilibacteraceae bacterium]|nr:glycerophosphodiester phosphodiesterase family protein [Motilibacteraceae bacterium]
HRGASEAVPEHTLAAYLKAIEDGADALECDVRLTRDGHLVCVHDRRVDRTSNGRGVVSTLELAELADLDWGSWHGRPPRPRGFARLAQAWEQGSLHLSEPVTDDDEAADVVDAADPASRHILTLARLLEVVADAGRPVQLAVETKHPTRYAGLVERRLVELLDRFGWGHPRLGQQTPVRVMSFSPLSLRRLRVLAPSLPSVLLMERVPLRYRDGTLPPGVRIAGPGIDVIRAHPRYVERVHRRGGAVHVWTVDRDEDVQRCLELGVDAIITNRPAHVLEAVRSHAG